MSGPEMLQVTRLERSPERARSGERSVIVGVAATDLRLSQPTPLDSPTTSAGRPKRNTFACTNCHAQKSKCVPSDVLDIYRKPCVRCRKRNKLCTFDLSRRTRRRHRNSSSSSNASVPVTPADVTTPAIGGAETNSAENDTAAPAAAPAAMPVAVPAAMSAAMPPTGNLDASPTASAPSLRQELQVLLASQCDNLNLISERLTKLSEKWNAVIENSFGVPLALDPVSLGLLTSEQAQYRLDLYRSEISSKYRFPFVKIPGYLSLDRFREQEPILFVTIMAIVSPMLKDNQADDDQNMKLDNFALGVISNHMMRLGNKSLELLKSLLTLCMWYNFPEWFNKTRFHFFNYICCCLIRDLIPVKRPRSFAIPREDDTAAIDAFLLQNPSYSRLVILVYVSALNINIFLRQPIQNKWGHLQDRACRIMSLFDVDSNSLYNREEDEILFTFAKLNRILETIHIKLHETEDEPLDPQDGLAPLAQINLASSLQMELQTIYSQIPPKRVRALAFYHSVEAYLHEWLFSRFMARFPDHSVIKELPAAVSESFRKFTKSCMSAMHEFLKLSPELIASLPLFHISRVIYTVGMLLIRVRYTSMTVPAFALYKELSQPAISLVRQISESLNESAALFPYNNFLSKLRYVVALFVQIYANKMKVYVKNSKSDAECLNHPAAYGASEMVPVPHQNSVPMLLNPVSPPHDSASVPEVPQNVDTSATELSSKIADELPYQLADMSSLEYGISALNDEFWTDVFLGAM